MIPPFLILLAVALFSTFVGLPVLLAVNMAFHATPTSNSRWARFILRVFGLLIAIAALLACQSTLTGMQFLQPGRIERLLLVAAIILVAGSIAVPAFLLAERLRKLSKFDRDMRRDVCVRWLRVVGYVCLAVGLINGVSLLAVMILLVVARLVDSRRVSKQTAVLWLLALAADGKRPLVRELEDFAAGERGSIARKANEAASLLRSGFTLSAALDSVPGLVPQTAVCQIRLGEATGSLPEALRQSAVTLGRTTLNRSHAAQNEMFWVFFCSLGLSLIGVLSYLSVFIVPKFKKIFEGFGTQLPEVTSLVFSLVDDASFYPVFIVVSCVPVAFLLMVAVELWRGKELVLIWPFSFLRPRLATPHVLRAIGLAVRSSRPINVAVESLAESFPEQSVQRRLQFVVQEGVSGVDVWTALSRARFLRPAEVELFFAADRASNLGWALDEMANGIERRQGYRFQVVLEFLQPACVVLAGLVVMFVEVALFMPLVKLLNDLS